MSGNLQEIYLIVSDGGDGSASIRYTKDKALAEFLVSEDYFEVNTDCPFWQNEGSYDTIVADVTSIRNLMDEDNYLSGSEKETFYLFKANNKL